MMLYAHRMAQAFEKHGIPKDDAQFEAAEIYRHATGEDPYIRVKDHPYYVRGQQLFMKDASERRCHREPIQYILKNWDFMDLRLSMGPGVFIPRADTEIVADEAIRFARSAGQNARAIDLCSGTGAIAIALARHAPQTAVMAVERSPEALKYLRENNAAYGGNVTVMEADVFTFQNRLVDGKIDLIVCNPPYIAPEEKETLPPELSYEPPEALFAENHGLAFYEHIAPAYLPALKPGGALILEIGWKQAKAVEEICRDAGYTDITIRRDLSENPRCVSARKKAD